MDLWIRDKYSGRVHKIGTDVHDCLSVDKSGTVHYRNLQNGDGCIAYLSTNKEKLSDRYPDHDWGDRKDEYVYGYEFVPNEDEYGYPYDPTEEESMKRFIFRITLSTELNADTAEDALDEFADLYGIAETDDIKVECIGEREYDEDR